MRRGWIHLALLLFGVGCTQTPVRTTDEPTGEPARVLSESEEKAIPSEASTETAAEALAREIAVLQREIRELRSREEQLTRALDTRSHPEPMPTPVARVEDEGDGPDFRQELAYRLVKNATAFTGSEPEEVSETTNATRAVRVLLVRDNAREVFLDLLDHASLAGQLYALCGLYYVDQDEFERAAKAYDGAPGVVEFAYVGAYLQTMKISDVVKNYVRGREFRVGVIESDYFLPALDLDVRDGTFNFDHYKKRLGEVRMRVPALERRLKFAVPEDDADACDGLVAFATIDPHWALPRLFRHLDSEHRVVRRQAGNVLALLAPWASLIMDRILNLFLEGSDEAVGEVTNVLLEEDLWFYAPLEDVTRFLDPQFASEPDSTVAHASYDDICDLIVEAVLSRPDLHRTSPEFLLRLMTSSMSDHAEAVLANLLMRGESGVDKIEALFAAASDEQRSELGTALSEPAIASWLPPSLEALLPTE